MESALALKSSRIETPLGLMLAIADEKALYFLEFGERHKMSGQMKRLERNLQTDICFGNTSIIYNIEMELNLYFAGQLKNFKTPINFVGSIFQKNVWKALIKIPYGQTCSYKQLAENIEKPTGFRAAANANGANALGIIVPCHRVINSSGALGGYAGGLERKKWLLEHEKKFVACN